MCIFDVSWLTHCLSSESNKLTNLTSNIKHQVSRIHQVIDASRYVPTVDCCVTKAQGQHDRFAQVEVNRTRL